MHLRNRIAVVMGIMVSLLSFACASAQEKIKPPSVQALVDRPKVTIGDTIRLTLRITTEHAYDFEYPVVDQTLSTFAVKDFGKHESKWFKKRTIDLWYDLDTYVTGTQTIPALSVKYKTTQETEWKEIKTSDVTIEVLSVLIEEGETHDIRDIKKPFSARSFSLLLVISVCVLLVAGSIGAVYWYRHTHVRREEVARRPAHEIALEALQALQRKDLIEKGNIKGYYFELSSIVREYVENRFQIKAPDMTTEEFLMKVRDESVLSHEQKSLLRSFLVQSDMVKFAKYGPSLDEITRSFEAARIFIEQTKEVIAATEVKPSEDL